MVDLATAVNVMKLSWHEREKRLISAGWVRSYGNSDAMFTCWYSPDCTHAHTEHYLAAISSVAFRSLVPYNLLREKE